MRFSLAFLAAGIIAPVLAGCKPSTCLSDDDAQAVIDAFHDILTNPDRQAANATAQQVIDTNYQESSDSINSLAGYPVSCARNLLDVQPKRVLDTD